MTGVPPPPLLPGLRGRFEWKGARDPTAEEDDALTEGSGGMDPEDPILRPIQQRCAVRRGGGGSGRDSLIEWDGEPSSTRIPPRELRTTSFSRQPYNLLRPFQSPP